MTRRQLLALGLTLSALKHRVRIRQLIPVYAGVYAVGHVPVASIDRAAGALLACGPKAVLGHGSAMSLWGFTKTWTMPFHVIAPSAHRRQGVCVHRSRALRRADVRRQLGLRVTSPARTALDVAPQLTDRQLERLVNDARLAGHLRLAALADVLLRFPRHPGAARLRPFLETPEQPTRSELEDLFVEMIRRYGLPMPKLNVKVGGREVDALFEAERLIVELDGYATHSERGAFEADRERDATSLLVGLGTIRITWARMTGQPDAEARRLAAILEARRAS